MNRLAEAFWLLPSVIVTALAALGALVVVLQESGALPSRLANNWLYGGGGTGARALLQAIASSSISVAGTIFSITIAALTLASSQMGPRLLRNFIRDRGNQTTLGVLLGVFAYSLVVLRSVRGGEGEVFVPALGVTVGLVLAGACVVVVIYFVHHVATRINVDTVIDLVHRELIEAIKRLPEGDEPDVETALSEGSPVRLEDFGYVQAFDTGLLKQGAGNRVRFVVRPGDFVFAGEVVALTAADETQGRDLARRAIVLGKRNPPGDELLYSVNQLVEVALRALSPGINDPMTAMHVIDRLGSALALLRNRSFVADAEPAQWPPLTYGRVVEAMFAQIRRHAASSPGVLLHLLSVLRRVASIETSQTRREVIGAMGATATEQARTASLIEADQARLAELFMELQLEVARRSTRLSAC